MKKLFLSLLLLLLILPSLAYSQESISWKPEIEMDNQIFPSYLLAKATKPIDTESEDPYYIGDVNGTIGVSITNPSKNSKIKVSIQVDPIIDLQEFDVTLPEEGQKYEIFPEIIWNWNSLRQVRQPIIANATFSLSVNGVVVESKNVVVNIRSINEAVTAYKYRESDEWEDTSWLFAAYVDEDNPWIDQLLREALNTGIVQQFDGYQSGREEQVYRQVYAIWNVLQRRGFTYSNITDSSLFSDKVRSQYVRFFKDSVRTSQANCVDGSVLFVSILRRIGIKGYLVLIPGHCFVLIDKDQGDEPDFFGLETTAMGAINLSKFVDDGSLSDLLGSMSKNEASWNTFVHAVDTGNKTYRDNESKINSQDTKYIQYQLIDIEQARQDKILPISN